MNNEPPSSAHKEGESTFPWDSRPPVILRLFIPRRCLQIVHHQTLRTSKRSQILRPPHHRITRRAPPRSQLIRSYSGWCTRQGFLGARGQRHRGERELIIVIVVRVQKIFLGDGPVAPPSHAHSNSRQGRIEGMADGPRMAPTLGGRWRG